MSKSKKSILTNDTSNLIKRIKLGSTIYYIADEEARKNALPSATTAGSAVIYDGTNYVVQTGYGYEKSGTTTKIDSKFIPQDNTKEDVANRVNSITSTSTNSQYPTAKAVYDYVQSQIVEAIGGSY